MWSTPGTVHKNTVMLLGLKDFKNFNFLLFYGAKPTWHVAPDEMYMWVQS